MGEQCLEPVGSLFVRVHCVALGTLRLYRRRHGYEVCVSLRSIPSNRWSISGAEHAGHPH